MQQKLSPQTSTFIFLCGVIFLGGFLVILISNEYLKNDLVGFDYSPLTNMLQAPQTTTADVKVGDAQIIVPDTSSWTLHQLAEYNISFKIPPTWKIKKGKPVDGYQVYEIDPGRKYINIRLYVSPKDYYVMDGVPAIKTTIGGKPALNASGVLYGVEAGGIYYTFDLGRSLTLTGDFQALIGTVQFNP